MNEYEQTALDNALFDVPWPCAPHPYSNTVELCLPP